MVTTETGCRLGVGRVPKLPFIQELGNFQVRKGDRKEQKQHYPLVAAKQYGNKVWNSKGNRRGVSLHSCCKENCMQPEGHQHWGDELESLYYSDRVHITQQEQGRRDQSPQTRPDKMKDTDLSLDPGTRFQGRWFHMSLVHRASNTLKHSKAFGKLGQLQQIKYLQNTVASVFHTLTNKLKEFIQGSPDKNFPTSHMLTPFCLYAWQKRHSGWFKRFFRFSGNFNSVSCLSN